MKIPKKIKIISRTIDIIRNDRLCDEKNVYGEARYNEGEIIYQNVSNGIPRKKDCVHITIIHEILHFVFWVLGYNDLKNDEKFICQLSEVLFQVIKQLNK